MDDEDRRIMRSSIKGLYEAANLTPPDESRIVFVSSPFVARFAAGFAAAICYLRDKKIKVPEYRSRERGTLATTRAYNDVLAATMAATGDSNNSLIASNPDNLPVEKNGSEFFVFDNQSMRTLSDNLGLGKFGLDCAYHAYNMLNGGNFWSGWVSYLTFFRYVAKLDLDYSKFDHYEKAAMHGSYRFMHKDFCIVSDRPEKLLVDARNRPHCDNGPYMQWRDGSCLYALDGVRVPQWLVETPREKLTVKQVMSITNVEVRRVAMKKIGLEHFLDPKLLIDKEDDYALYLMEFEGVKMGPYLKMQCPSTGRIYVEGVGDADKYDNIDPNIKTCRDALQWRLQKASNALVTRILSKPEIRA
jgi:hypothetical protein